MSSFGLRIIRRPPLESAPDGTEYVQLVPGPEFRTAPFSTGIARVPAGSVTSRHNHQDTELFVVLSGRALLEWEGGQEQVAAGDVVVLPPFTDHSVINAPGQEDVTFVNFWWTQRETYEPRAAAYGQGLQAEGQRGIYVVATVAPSQSAPGARAGVELLRVQAELVARALRQQGHHVLQGAVLVPGGDEPLAPMEAAVLRKAEWLLQRGVEAGVFEWDGGSAGAGGLTLRLERFRQHVMVALWRGVLSTAAKRLYTGLLAQPLPDVTVAEPGPAGQPAERASPSGLLCGVARALLWLEEVGPHAAAGHVRPVFFCQPEEGLLPAVLLPVLTEALGLGVPWPHVLHAVEPPTDAPVLAPATGALPEEDRLRLLLCAAREETAAEGAGGAGPLAGPRERLSAWAHWLGDLLQRVEHRCGGRIPEAGRWPPRQLAAFAELEDLLRKASRAVAPGSLSPTAYLEALEGVVTLGRRLGQVEPGFDANETFEADSRTALALELAAARQLGVLLAPLMPGLSDAIGVALGLVVRPADVPWSEGRVLLASGARVARAPLVPWLAGAVPAHAQGSLRAGGPS